jgi:aspartyl-tRNA(Asn)/glutamyl-tRNA(Gln) amidotransferase subunit C
MSGTKIDRARIEHVAKLASLTLTDAEADRLTEEITKILGHVDELAQIDTSGVEMGAALASPAASALREDVVLPSFSNAEALAQAPRKSGEPGQAGFVVPVFVES